MYLVINYFINYVIQENFGIDVIDMIWELTGVSSSIISYFKIQFKRKKNVNLVGVKFIKQF